ncbi:hypothetical protein L9F63_021938, partial [Diploptera punctata]
CSRDRTFKLRYAYKKQLKTTKSTGHSYMKSCNVNKTISSLGDPSCQNSTFLNNTECSYNTSSHHIHSQRICTRCPSQSLYEN